MKSSFLCPSAPLYPGSKLLGIVKGDNTVDILEEPLEVDDQFVASANTGKAAGQKFRFVNKCLKSGCEQWTGDTCGVIKRVIDAIDEKLLQDELPACSIRSSCRWFDQEGAAACKACTMVKYI
ncbi:MAG: hypothetical protein JST39_02615 [Bacteroidetes bacterium]|nr:hypothetical protein [Bacteroidota bacterium]